MGDGFFVVVALGDSLTAGYRVLDPYAIDPRVPYPAQLEALLRERLGGRAQSFVVNAGLNGDSTDGMLWRFGNAVAPEQPDAVVVGGGINDLGAARDPEAVMANLLKLYARCEEIGAKPVACTLTPTRRTSPNTITLNDLIRAHASEKDMALADLFPALADGDGNLRAEYSDDGVHLTPAGYRKVAETVLKALKPLITEMEP
jgi:lysophospholipase L1-like esterase